MQKIATESPLATPIDQTKPNAMLKAWARVISSTAHDLISPLTSTRMMNQALEKMLPHLKNAYILAVENNLMKSEISDKHLEITELFSPEFEQSMLRLLEFLKAERSYVEILNSEMMAETHSIKVYFDGLLKNYPFKNEGERAAIQVRIHDDFNLQCAPIFVESLLIDLLGNALSNIKVAGKGEVHIWTETQDGWNTLHFKDTGEGITSEALSATLDHSLSKQNGEMKPGLALCRVAIMLTGGEIFCHSIKGGDTEFTIKFHQLKAKEI